MIESENARFNAIGRNLAVAGLHENANPSGALGGNKMKVVGFRARLYLALPFVVERTGYSVRIGRETARSTPEFR